MNPALLALAVTIGAPTLKDKPPSPVGEWVVEQSIDNGSPAIASGQVRWTFNTDGNWFIVGSDGKESVRGKYTTDPKASPASLDLDIVGQKHTHPCIFKVEGDSLILVLAAPQKARPTAFESAASSQHTLYVFKRVQKD